MIISDRLSPPLALAFLLPMVWVGAACEPPVQEVRSETPDSIDQRTDVRVAAPDTLEGAERDSLAAYVRRHYTEPLFPGPQRPINDLDMANRFHVLGEAEIIRPLPDRDFCTHYFSVEEGTYCSRNYVNELFRTHPVDPFLDPAARAVRPMIHAGLAADSVRYGPLLFPFEITRSERAECGSYFVNELLTSIDSILGDTYRDAPRGAYIRGLSCRIDGRLVHIPPDIAQGWSYRLWDLFEHGGRIIALIARSAHDQSMFEVFELDGEELRKLLRVSVFN